MAEALKLSKDQKKDVKDAMDDAQKEAAPIHEQIARNMETEVTIEDPKAYTKPWTVKFNHKIMLDEELIEFICGENEKDAPHLVAK